MQGAGGEDRKGMLWSAGEGNIRGIPYTDTGCRHGSEANNDHFNALLCVLRSDCLGTNTKPDCESVEDSCFDMRAQPMGSEGGEGEDELSAARAGTPRQTEAKITNMMTFQNYCCTVCSFHSVMLFKGRGEVDIGYARDP